MKNGKIYIGKTNNFEHRMRGHKSRSKNNSNYALHNAIRKHGWENFKKEIIFHAFDEDFAYNIEKEFIKEYNSCLLERNNNGYNMTFGGDGITSERAKQSIIEQKKTKKYWELRKFIGKNLVKSGKHNFLGGAIQLERLNNGTHNFLNSEEQRNKQVVRLKNGTHNFLSEEHKERNRNKCNELLTCPHCGITRKRLSMIRWHFENCKHKIK